MKEHGKSSERIRNGAASVIKSEGSHPESGPGTGTAGRHRGWRARVAKSGSDVLEGFLPVRRPATGSQVCYEGEEREAARARDPFGMFHVN